MRGLRPLFITDRCDFPEVPGPSRAGAAAAMLHSPKQWDTSYDKHGQLRQSRDTAFGMELYRKSMLGAKKGGRGRRGGGAQAAGVVVSK